MKHIGHISFWIFLVSQMLRVANCPAQELDNSTLMRYAGNIHQFNQIFPQEKVYLQFDNTAYFQGETIWFKAFVVTATTLQRAPSGVLYVELLSPSGEVLQQQKLKIVAGQCDGSFDLVDGGTRQSREKRGMVNYPSGFYEVRAYTQYMLNFDQSIMFSRVFPIYAQPEKEGQYDESLLFGDLDRNWGNLREGSIAPGRKDKVTITLYPESGHYVKGLESVFAFEAVDQYGIGVDGKIIDRNSSEVLAETVHDGMGRLVLSGNDNRNLVFESERGRTPVALPQAERSGWNLSVDGIASDRIDLSLNCSSDQVTADSLGLSVTCRGELVHFCTIPAQQGITSMDASEWPVGVCRIVLFNNDGHVLAARSIFHGQIGHRTPSLVAEKVTMNKNPFALQKISLNLKDQYGNAFRDRFCLSIRDGADYGNGYSDNLLTDLLLSSDLKGYIRKPDFYFESDDAVHKEALDLLLMIHGWERYDWSIMTGNAEFAERHRLEEKLSLNGWVNAMSSRKPIEGIKVLASLTPQENKEQLELFEYVTTPSGYFGFDIRDFWGKGDFTVKLSTTKKSGSPKEKNARISMERSGIPEAREMVPQEFFLGENRQSKVIVHEDTDEEDYPTIIGSDGVVLDDVDITAKRQFIDYDTFKAFDAMKDTELELDKGEYTTDIYGYLLEKGLNIDMAYVATFASLSGNGNYYDSFDNLTMNGRGVLLYIHNKSKAVYNPPFDLGLNIDMIDVKSILVYDKPMTRKYMSQFIPFIEELARKHADIDYIIKKETDYKKYYLIDVLVKEDHELKTKKEIRNIGKRVTNYNGFTETASFYAPTYPDGPIPGDVDYRRTLYWNPNVITDSLGYAEVEFYNNSYSTHFNVSGAGITASGTPYVLDQDF